MMTYVSACAVRAAALLRMAWSSDSVLVLTVILCAVALSRAEAATQQIGKVSSPAPKVSPSLAKLTFSDTPTNDEFLHTGLFSEPLAPVSTGTSSDNRDLAKALLTYRDAVEKTGRDDAVEPILSFLATHPDSPWKPALELDLGIVYRHTGHFSKALEIWQTGWLETQSLTDPEGRALANAMVARLSQLEAYLGRKELLQPLLDSLKTRPIGGTSAQLITDSHTGLYDMQNEPGESFRCGPLALKRILTYSKAKASPVSLNVLDAAKSTPNGLSLAMVQKISARAGMNYQMAFRTPGAPVIMPAVAHWKVGHYAAVVAKKNGRYLVQDTTFGEDIHVSPATLDEEASGYFLIPHGRLPQGWRKVSVAEGQRIWGRGDTGTNHDSGATGCNCGNTGYTIPAVEQEVVGLQLNDSPVGYTPPVGPLVRFNLVYSHRDTQQPTTFSYTNFGPKWTFNWLSYVTDSVSTDASASLYRRGGGNEPFTFSSTSATSSYPGPYSQSTLTRTDNGFTLSYPDGSVETFNQALGSQYFMTATADPAGNTVTLTYDDQMRVTAITDAVGQVSTITYGLSSSPLVVTQITDPFGRSATFTYTSDGHLAVITDALGLTSSYTYGQGSDPDFVNTLSTPYGKTTFIYADSTTNPSLGATRSLKTTDPLGRASYVEFSQTVNPGDAPSGSLSNSSLAPTGMSVCIGSMSYRNTFVFDANEYAAASQTPNLNYALAHVIHWLHTSDSSATSRMKESERQPLENRVWYNYPAQTSCEWATVSSTGTVIDGASSYPSAIGRVLDSGATQLQKYSYNSQGNITLYTDPVGRKTAYTYASNGVDVLSITNTTNGTQALETRTYNSRHKPLTVTGANGSTAHYQYNSFGLVTRYTDQKGHVTTYTYDGTGHLKTVQRPVSGATYSYAYDNVGRVASVTDPGSATVRFSYDAFDRPVNFTYPDGTTAERVYHLLDLASVTDRLGQTTTYSYDADRELIASTDPAGNTIQYGYNQAGALSALTDQNGHTTTMLLDTQSRRVGKTFADGYSVSIAYQNAMGLVALFTDALGQTTSYSYNADSTLATVSYGASAPTANVSFSYDSSYARQTSMTDGTGTTIYTYYPISGATLGANQLQSITSPVAGTTLSDTVTYSYDARNQVVGYSVNGVAQQVSFDALGRKTSTAGPLDTFTYSYSDGTDRVTGITSDNGPNVSMSYYGAQGDELLQSTQATSQSGASLAQFSYNYDSDEDVIGVTVSQPSAETTSYTYDPASRLNSAYVGAASTPTYSYGYDAASNLTSITSNGSAQSYSYTATNENQSGVYDGNGSPTQMNGRNYAWDGANRLIQYGDNSGNNSSFTYDGLGRLVRIVDAVQGAVTADHSYFWCGSQRCLAHDNTQSGSPVSSQYFGQGVIVGGTPYYYVRDELSSVYQLLTAGGTMATQLSYDPFGNQTTSSGGVSSDMGYAGYFYHSASGLNFTLSRAYDSVHGRWLNRDPIGEAGGVNLYAYVLGDPISQSDPSGLYPAIQVTMPDGTSFIPMTVVKNPTQAAAYGIPVGTPTAIATPPGANPQGDVNCWKNSSNKGLSAFKKYWADPKHNYKVVNGPIYDAYGNFMYGATGDAAGVPLWLLEGVAEYLHGWNNNPINSADIAAGYYDVASGATLNVIDYQPQNND